MGWCAAYYKSNFHPGHLPYPGGYDNQPKSVIHDLNVYMRGVAWAQGEHAEDAALSDEDKLWAKIDER